jgi:hypothetical protein
LCCLQNILRVEVITISGDSRQETVIVPLMSAILGRIIFAQDTRARHVIGSVI